MFMNARAAGLVVRHWRAGQWLADGSFDTVAQINRQCLAALGEMSRAGQLPLPALRPLAWEKLSGVALARLAGCPYLLADAGFDDEARWRCLDLDMVRDQPAHLAGAVFTGPGGADFIRRVLVFGWYLARVNRQLARVALGMSPPCAERLAGLQLHDLDWLAQCRPGWVRPRWERNPQIWRQLLEAAAEPGGGRLAEVSLRGLQLMAAGLLATNPAGERTRRG
jgi:hypothetical protein